MLLKNSRLKKILIILGAGLALYALVGFFLLPVLGKIVLTDKLSTLLNRNVFIEKIFVNPFSLEAAVKGVAIKEKNQDILFSAEKIYANLSLSSIFTITPVVSGLSLEMPHINLIRNMDGSFNFSDLLNTLKADEPASKEANNSQKGIMGFVVKNAVVTGGEVRFEDKANGVSHLVKEFAFSLPFLSSKIKNRLDKATMDIGFVLNAAPVDIHIESTPFTEDLSTQADIKTSDFDVVQYLAYLPIPENVRLKNLGLNLDIRMDFLKNKSGTALQVQGLLDARNADIKGSAGEEILKFPALKVNIAPSDILANQLNISKILILTPEVNLDRDKDGKLNLVKYIPQKNGDQEEEKKTVHRMQKPFILNLAEFDIKDARILFKDSASETLFDSKVYPLNLTIKNFKTGNSISGEYQFHFETEIKEKMASAGKFQTHPVQASGTINLSDILISKYAPYYEAFSGFKVNEGRVTLSSDFDISLKDDKPDIVVRTQEFLIQSLSILDPQSTEEMISIPEFKISESILDIGNKKIDAGNITAKNGKFSVKRQKNGQINLVSSIMPEKVPQNKADTTTESGTDVSGVQDSPWAVTVNSFEAAGFNILFNDLSNIDPVKIDLSNLFIRANDLKNLGEEKGRVDIQLNWGKKGRASVKGDVTPSISQADLEMHLEKIDIKSFQPYFTDFIRILVTDGNVNASGRVKMDLMNTSGDKFRFTGETSVTNFISVDKTTAKDFFTCNSFYLSGIDLSVFPVKVTAKDISLTDFYSRIIVSETGETNLSTVLNPDRIKDQETKADEKPAESTSKIPQIGVESITLQGGEINFSDYFTRPNFTASMKQIAGAVTGLSSDETSRAKLHLKGVHGQSSPLNIVGTINPLIQKKFADIDITFKDIELSNFTPYSSKYLGYKIEKGKLILDLKYMIDGNLLKSENRVSFDNLTLGEKVNSEHATALPIGLAISLLKNREGKIDLDLPVTGKMDDPEFKLGSIIFKMVGNLILKVVTSPFAIIGSMFGGGEELGFVEFAYGDIGIDDMNYEKLDKLAQILQAKPSIKLEIQGVYDPLLDAEGLRVKLFEDLIKAEKLKEKRDAQTDSDTLEEVVITSEDVEQYIDSAYSEAQFPKPRDEAGVEKELELGEKKKLLITNIAIDGNDLRALAMNRSEKIKEYLLSTGKVEKERVFLLEPNAHKDSKAERTSMVRFSLK